MTTLRERLVEAAQDRLGYTVERTETIKRLQESDWERRLIQRDLDLLAYTALNYVGGRPQELKAMERRRLVQRARVVWMKDPQAGAAIDLMNDFVFGRGMSKPRANDPQVQEVIDEFWLDPDVQLVLTDYQSQLALGTDLEIQSNLFLLIFEDGEDGKVKLGLLDHDAVENVVRDEDNRLRVMYYLARHYQYRWNFASDQPEVLIGGQVTNSNRGEIAGAPTKQEGPPLPTAPTVASGAEVRYYQHWRNVDLAVEEFEAGARDEEPNLCPDQKLGDGKVYHVAINRGSETAFGHPRMDRVLRWYSAFNSFMDARVDMMAASAAFVMKRKVRGTPQQLQRQATQALSRRSVLGMSAEPNMMADVGPKAAGIVSENDSVEHEPFNLNSNSQNAQGDAQMLRSQISAATRFPASYYGDASQANLATATSLELPVLKAVESRQEIFEQVVRFCVDRAIERAVDSGRLDVTGKKAAKDKPAKQPSPTNLEPSDVTQEAYDGQQSDEDDTEMDLGYEFSMPSPLKRLIGDLVTAAQVTAQAFDPNNSNTELSRVLLAVVLGEAFEIEDPAGAVERIFPAGYVDPAVAAAEGPPGGAGGGGGPGMGEFSPAGETGGFGQDPNNQYSQGFGAGNPYGAAQSSQAPEDAMQQARVQEAAETRERWRKRIAEVERMFDEHVDAASNGHG